MKPVSLFLGCIIPNRYPGIEKATKLVLDGLGIDWAELTGASCCPAPGVFRSFDKVTWLTLAARNIVLSEQMDRDVLTICNGCFGSLVDANHELKKDPGLAKQVNKHLGEVNMKYNGSAEIRHIIEFLSKEFGPEKIKDAIKRPLDLKVALHYGCHLIKPSKERDLGTVEKPVFFDELVEALGAQSIDYEDKMACCGAGGGVRSALPDKSLEMADAKLLHIAEAGADCIVNACPFCHLQLDFGQVEIKDKFGHEYNIPVLHYSQLLAIAMGYSPEDVGVDLNFITDDAFIDRLRG
ncbi:MAG: CoB--CoM heterodisulfide reductase subunit B [ANME-2 cluster archaeon]|jgi:heterodisulfide reductase subunit B|nr:CoB--CoM heterodisulfide reductase subunit B [ANME-2 cluster archaeon]